MTTQSDPGIGTVAVVIAAISGVAALGLAAAAVATGRAGCVFRTKPFYLRL